jgi:hypothetical protein
LSDLMLVAADALSGASPALSPLARASLPPFVVGAVGAFICGLGLLRSVRFFDISGIGWWLFVAPAVVGFIAGGVSTRGARLLGLIVGLAGVCAGTLAAWGGRPEGTSVDTLAPTLLIACPAFAVFYGLTAVAMNSLRASHNVDTSDSPPHRSAWAAAPGEEGSESPEVGGADGSASDPQAVDDAFGHVQEWFGHDR